MNKNVTTIRTRMNTQICIPTWELKTQCSFLSFNQNKESLIYLVVFSVSFVLAQHCQSVGRLPYLCIWLANSFLYDVFNKAWQYNWSTSSQIFQAWLPFAFQGNFESLHLPLGIQSFKVIEQPYFSNFQVLVGSLTSS